MEQEILKAIDIFKNGGIVIFPTDTAFGVGCRIDERSAIEKLFKIRLRPEGMATPVLVSSQKMAQEYLEPVQRDVSKLMNKYWPGALTIVLPCKVEKIPFLVRGGGTTLGVRIPNHQTTLSIIRGVGVPILGPSANFHGKLTPYKFGDLDPKLLDLVDFVVHGETSIGQVSTVIDCSKKPWKILRQGVVEIANELTP